MPKNYRKQLCAVIEECELGRKPEKHLDMSCDELWSILVGSEPCSDDDGGVDDDDDWEGDKGYDRDAATRRDDCDRVHSILASGISADVRSRHGASLLYHALEYDHRHAPEMIKIVVENGADVNMPTHVGGSELPLDCELWLEQEGPFAAVNAQKHSYLVSHGARHSSVFAANLARANELAAEAASAKAAELAAADAALDQRLREVREAELCSRVPVWDH